MQAFLVENCTTVKGTSRTSEEGLGNIFIEDASAEWEANRSVLNQININLPAGYLGIVIGQVGAGKVRQNILILKPSFLLTFPIILKQYLRDNLLLSDGVIYELKNKINISR